MDLGDWQELARLRFENHLWHRCLEDIVSAARNHQLPSEKLESAIGDTIDVLNGRLQSLGRRTVPCRMTARGGVGRRN